MLKLWVTLGVGLWPGAPGTYGSILTAAIAAAIVYGFSICLCGPYYLAFLLIFSLLAFWGIDRALKLRLLGDDPDPGSIVIDEAVGVLAAMYGCVAGGWPQAVAAVACFRFFDIVKPWPVGPMQKLPGAWGVLLDDLVAGILAWLAAYAVGAFFA